jgi:hypothetical protein
VKIHQEDIMATGTARGTARLIAILAFALSLAATAAVADPARLAGGPKGVVKSTTGELLEGIMVQLIAKQNAVRTTVYSNADGRYEFPALDPGTYTLRIARPREFHPFVKEGVDIKGATPLADISLEYVTDQDTLPPLPEIMAQMTGSEWLMSLSGTGAEKKLLTNNCNWCHSYQQIFRNHYNEEGWGKIVYRMIHGAGSPLININERGRWGGDEEARLVKWLASVRGPDVKDPQFVMLPRPQGRQTRVIVTEYELPRLETATHDVTGDSKGNLWYSTHRSSYIGRLDPATGAVKEFHVPPVAEGVLPGIGSTPTRTTSSGARRTGRTASGGSTPRPSSSPAFPGRCASRPTSRWAAITRSIRTASSGRRASARSTRWRPSRATR